MRNVSVQREQSDKLGCGFWAPGRLQSSESLRARQLLRLVVEAPAFAGLWPAQQAHTLHLKPNCVAASADITVLQS